MRKIIALVLLSSQLTAQNLVHIPDTAFASYLAAAVPPAMTGQSLNITHTLVSQGTKSLALHQIPAKNLFGIQYFSSLEYLACDYCDDILQIPSLPPSLKTFHFSYGKVPPLPQMPDSLEVLNLYSCSLTALPKLNDGLKHLGCAANQVSIKTLPASLETLNCNFCGIVSLPALPNTLKSLSCAYNLLSSLPPLSDGLEALYCQDNFLLTSMPVLPASLKMLVYTNCPTGNVGKLLSNLELLRCDNTGTDTLDITPLKLSQLVASDNQIRTLPVLPASLGFLHCSTNNLTSLPVLPDSLQVLYCSHNQLKSLPALPETLIQLDCSHNQLTSLPDLPFKLGSFSCGGNQITCFPELPCCTWHPGKGSPVYHMNLLPNPITCLPRRTESMHSSHWAYPICTTEEMEACLSVTGISEPEHSSLRLFPNPASNVIQIDPGSSRLGEIKIYDASGRLISTTTKGENTISVQEIAAGLYILIATIDERKVSKRVVIAR